MNLGGGFVSVQGSGLGNNGNERQPAARHSTLGHTFPFGDSEGLAEKAEAPRVHLAKKEVSEESLEKSGFVPSPFQAVCSSAENARRVSFQGVREIRSKI